MTRPVIHSIAPFFIVRSAIDAIAFYRDKLGFNVLYHAEVRPRYGTES